MPVWNDAVDHTWPSLLVLDRTCRFTRANKAACELARSTPDGLIGKRFCEVFAPAPCPSPRAKTCAFAHAIRGMERRSRPRWRTLAVHNHEVVVLVGATSLDVEKGDDPTSRDAAIVTIVPSALIDEADRKRREMVAAAIHEMRHPVTVQGITIDLLRAYASADLSPDAAAMIQRMERATAYLTACIDELQNRMLFDLDFMTIRPQLIGVRASVEAVVWQHEPLLLRRRQRVALRVAHDLEVWADPVALGHVLANLLVNAHKHAAPDDTFEISARRLRGSNQVEIRVRDHGPGIPAAERRRIFDRFYRGTQAQNQRGAGLGLSIVKSLVQQHGGTIRVAAARGGGALFRILLPMSGPPDQ